MEKGTVPFSFRSGSPVAAAAAATECGIKGQREQLGDRRMVLVMAAALDLDADAGGVGLDGKLLDADAGVDDARMLEADGGDILGQSLDQIDVALGDMSLDGGGDAIVGQHVGEIVVQRR